MGWRPFRRRRILIDLRQGCGCWRFGELAVCVRGNWRDPTPPLPQPGEFYLVTAVDERQAAGTPFLIVGLGLERMPADARSDARSFRKAVRDDQPASADFRLPVRRTGGVPA